MQETPIELAAKKPACILYWSPHRMLRKQICSGAAKEEGGESELGECSAFKITLIR